MAERWQQWMPFHIDKFRGSPEVQAMHPAARCGYIYLLASAWQSADCTISADPLDLATESGLGDELWALYGTRILRKFEFIDGRLRNSVLFVEWSEAFRVYEKRKSGALRTNESRSASGERTQSSRNTDTQTLTGTVTTTKTKVQEQTNTLASTADAVPAFILPDWVNSKAWDGFVEMRKRKRSNPTDHAKVLLVKKLASLKAVGHDPTEVLEHSTMTGYQGLFPPPKQNGATQPRAVIYTDPETFNAR